MTHPVHLQIVEHFRDLIDTGEFLPGAQLPSNREVGLVRGVSRETVSKAFKQLQVQGYVYTTPEGTFVRDGERKGEDAERRGKFEAVLRSWESEGFVGPAWTVRWDGRDGCYRVVFTLFATWGPTPRYYDLNEAEFCMYVRAVADWMPDEAGEAAVALAGETHDEDDLP